MEMETEENFAESSQSSVCNENEMEEGETNNQEPQRNLSTEYVAVRNRNLEAFEHWTQTDQVDFIENLLLRMRHHQQVEIYDFVTPMLQRDFISLLPRHGLHHISETILSYLDAKSLGAVELVCKDWNRAVADAMLWKKLIERNVRSDTYPWKGLAERRGWMQYLFKPSPGTCHPGNSFYRQLYPRMLSDIRSIDNNWMNGDPTLQVINCGAENSKGVYCLQFDESKIVSGLRDNTIKIWDKHSLQCTHVLAGHTGSVLCLQYDDKIIISGSSDATVCVWDVKTGVLLNTLINHLEAVLHLKFLNSGVMVTCSKDRTITVWNIVSPTSVNIIRTLMGHQAAVNVVDLDEKYIVSASGDRTIKVWNATSCEFIRTLQGHRRGIACLQYQYGLIVSGSSDNTIRVWDIELGVCLRTIVGHEELVRCIQFDKKRIVSGAYDGKIKVWDLRAALNKDAKENSLCIRTLFKHTGRVFRLQIDEFQIVSSSHDDTILIWDFLNSTQPENPKKVKQSTSASFK